MNKVCQCCGRSFTPSYGNEKYCSVLCRRQYEKQIESERRFARNNKRESKSLDDKVKAAAALGVSYGYYVLIQKGVISL